MLDLLILPGGLFIALVGIVVGAVTILHHQQLRAKKRPAVPWALQTAGMLATGSLASVPGVMWGIRHFCAAPDAGAQCGLGGIFGTGPMAFGIGTLLYAAAYVVWDME